MPGLMGIVGLDLILARTLRCFGDEMGGKFGSKSKIAVIDEALHRDWQAIDHSNLSNGLMTRL
jgi:hypothetical protein